MKEQQRLLQEIALMLEHQDMLSKLTESQCLDEYGYSETHCIDNIGRLELGAQLQQLVRQMRKPSLLDFSLQILDHGGEGFLLLLGDGEFHVQIFEGFPGTSTTCRRRSCTWRACTP